MSRCLPGRLLLTSWWLFSLLTVAVYTANMAAFLTATRCIGIVVIVVIVIFVN